MSVAFILGQRQTAYDPTGLIAFHETEAQVRDAYQQAAETTGIDVEHLLHNIADGEQQRRVVASVGLAAAMIGIHDVLLGRGFDPVAIGGLSLGTMVGTALAGSLDRAELYRLLLLAEMADAPDETGRAQGCAGAVLPVGSEYESFYGTQEGIWLAGDFGMHESGAFRMLLVAGYRDVLDEVASRVPKEYFLFNEEPIAPHCPLRQHVADQVAEHLKSVTLADPVTRLCSCLERGTLTTASEVADMLVRNIVSTVHLDAITQEMVSNGAKLGVVLGPTLPHTFEFPFPIVYVDAPEHISQIASTALTAGITL
jgi:[acyl-carrier-protein] S-malonyltransferase